MTGQRSPLAQLSTSQQWQQQLQQTDSAALRKINSQSSQRRSASERDVLTSSGSSGEGGQAVWQQQSSPLVGPRPTPPHSRSSSAGTITPLQHTSLSLRDAVLAQSVSSGGKLTVPPVGTGVLGSAYGGMGPVETCVSPQLPTEVSVAPRRHSGPATAHGAALRDSCPVVSQTPQRLEAAQLRPIAKSGDWPLRDRPRPMLQIPVRGSFSGGRDRYGCSDAGCSPDPDPISPGGFQRSPTPSDSPVRATPLRTSSGLK